MAKRTLSLEMRNAIVWLEQQPGVTSVVQGRYTRVRHKNTVGSARIVLVDVKHAHIRLFDKDGTKDLYAYAPPSPYRDAWVAALASGDPFGQNGNGPRVVKPEIKTVKSGEAVPRPTAAQENVGQVFDVTPDLAMKWLEHNTRNRKLRQSVVNKYAADMRAGRWLLSPDAIAFDVNGAIIEGQHRLWAVIESGCTVKMLVVFGMAPETIEVVGDHLKRNLADVAGIRRPGTSVHSVHTAVANLLLTSSIIATAVDRRQALGRVSRQAQLDSLDRHWDAIEFVYRECFRSSKRRSITVAGVLTPMARAYYTQDRDRLREFGLVMMNGMANGGDDQAAIILRNFLLRAVAGNTRPLQDVVYRKTERALAAFLEREKISTLYEAQSELFPLPQDERPKLAKKG